AAEKIGPEGVAYGIDGWSEGIEMLTRIAFDKGLINVKAIVADITYHIPLSDNCVDICLMATVLHDLARDGRFTPGIIATNFTRLDDSDILVCAKYWSDDNDFVLSDLSGRLLKRNLFAVELQNEPFEADRIEGLKKRAGELLGLNRDETDYYVFSESISNLAYAPDAPEVRILLKNGTTAPVSSVSEMFGQGFISERITKYFICYPKECRN
ncbi:MAG: class I SAM-dependent methyltransferase, partial [Bacteroidales bacterium]|nr:class I SAM-dependent methyltransferase [Bacteroidales bacterium]